MKMPQSEQKVLDEVKFLQGKYFTFDEPIPFCGLELYPVNVRHYTEFLSTSECFLLNKNDDPKGLGVSHLEYLIQQLKDPEKG